MGAGLSRLALDLHHHTFEEAGRDLELRGRRFGEEQPLHPVEMDLLGRAVLRPSAFSEHSENAAAIGRTRTSLDQPEFLEAGHDAGDAASGEDHVIGDLGHPSLAPGPGEMQQDLELTQGEVASGPQVGVELPGDEGMAAEESAPGRAFEGGKWGGRGGGGHQGAKRSRRCLTSQ
jgi:hypothetical protein